MAIEHEKILSDIRKVKQNLGWDWDYEDGYGELKHMVFTALDVADELREAVLVARAHGEKVVYGKDIPDYYKPVILKQLKELETYLVR